MHVGAPVKFYKKIDVYSKLTESLYLMLFVKNMSQDNDMFVLSWDIFSSLKIMSIHFYKSDLIFSDFFETGLNH